MITPQELQKHIINDAAETAADSSLLSTHETQIDTYDGQGEFTQRFIDSLVAARKASTSVSRALGNTARSAGEGIKSIDPRERIRGISIPEISLPTDRIAAARKKLGSVALAFLMIPTGLTAGAMGTYAAMDKIGTDAQEEIEDQTPQETEVSVKATTSTTTPPTTSTTQEQIADTQETATIYEATIGEQVGLLVSPVECESIIHVMQVSVEQEEQMGDGTRRSPVDQLRLLPEEQRRAQVCSEQAIQHANEFGYPTRPERMRAARNKSFYPSLAEGTQSTAGDYIAIAGKSGDISPGQRGNAVIFAHGSTESAAYNDLGAMKIGDKKYFVRSDGKVFVYTMIEREILPDDENLVNEIYNYSGTQDSDPNNSFLSEYGCVDANGKPGSDSHRLVVRSEYTNTISMEQLQAEIGPEYTAKLQSALEVDLASQL